MRRLIRSNSRSPRTVLAAAWGTVCSLIIAAPVLSLLSFHAASCIVRLAFSCVCHQIPERSFALMGCPLPVCHRCAGLYLGMLLGSLFGIEAVHRSASVRRACILAAAAAILLDALAPAVGLWTGTAAGRFSTGLLFGTVTSSVLARGLAELLCDAPRRPPPLQTSILKGGLQ